MTYTSENYQMSHCDTTNEKCRFLSQYFGQVLLIRNHRNEKYSDKIENHQYNYSGWESLCSLELTPLSKITDDDAIKAINIFNSGHHPHYEFVTKSEWNNGPKFKQVYYEIKTEDGGDSGIDNLRIVANFTDKGIHVLSSNREMEYWRILDFLRSKGYAVPFMEYSVEDLVSLGWIRLS